VDRKLVDQDGPPVLLADVGAAHHGHILVAGGVASRLEGMLDPLGDEAVHASGRRVCGDVMGEDEQRDAGRAGRAVGAPPGDRVVVGASPADHRAEAAGAAGGDLAVAPVVAEGPLVQLLAPVAQ
jgi:hypothetical protein